MTRRALGDTGIGVFPLCLGGNVMGWTADTAGSFAVLDAFLDAGGNFIDTADAYSTWVPGNVGGESESIIGRWMRDRRVRERVIVATKVGKLPGLEGLSPRTIRLAVEGSLRRLKTDYIDLYYAHADDPATPLLDTLQAFDALVKDGKVRHLGASNYGEPRLRQALDAAAREGLAQYVVLQPHHNLVHRSDYAGALRALCTDRHIACVPYFALASGFLTGKYRPGVTSDSPRAGRAAGYLDNRGLHLLAALDEMANERRTTLGAVALAWLLADETIAAPIASARTPAQLADLLPAVSLRLSDEDVRRLTAM